MLTMFLCLVASSTVGHVCVFTILAAKATRSKGQNMKPGSMLPLTMSNIREIKLVDRINCMHVTCLSGCYPPLQHGHPPPLSGFAHQSIVSPPSPGWGQVLTLIQLYQLLCTKGQPPTQLHFPTAFTLMAFSHGKHVLYSAMVATTYILWSAVCTPILQDP